MGDRQALSLYDKGVLVMRLGASGGAPFRIPLVFFREGIILYDHARSFAVVRRCQMPYSKELDSRIEAAVRKWNTTSKKMFGGTCHLLNGNMMCGVHKNHLILRLGEAEAQNALRQPHVRAMDITGKPMKGWIMVDEADLEGIGLENWLEKARRFAETLPPK
jgi:TfoX/Sxy family transcriptional regulator of competence genes